MLSWAPLLWVRSRLAVLHSQHAERLRLAVSELPLELEEVMPPDLDQPPRAAA